MLRWNSIKIVLVESQDTGKWLANQLEKSNCVARRWRSSNIQNELKTIAERVKYFNVRVVELIK